MKKTIIITALAAAGLITVLAVHLRNGSGYGPAPTELVERKIARKEFKLHRKEWIRDMHRAHPDTDWKAMDDSVRMARQARILSDRRERMDGRELDRIHDVRFGSRNYSGTWMERGSNNLSGRIHAAEVDFSNGYIYCGSSGGNIWRGLLDGSDWISLNDYLQIPGIRFLAVIGENTSSRLLIGTDNERFYYTDNDGLTLETPAGLGNGIIVRTVITPEPDPVVYTLTFEYISGHYANVLYRSVDQGSSFQPVHEFTPASVGDYDIWTSRYEDTPLYVIHNGELYRMFGNDEPVLVESFQVSGSGNVHLTGGVDNGTVFFYARIGTGIYHSDQNGTGWDYMGEQPEGTFMRNSFSCSNLYSERVYLGGVELHQSSNSGQDWELVNPWWTYYDDPATELHADVPEVRFFKSQGNTEFGLISTDGGLYITYDNLENVHNLSMSGLGVSQYYSTYTARFAPYHVYAGSQDQGFQRSLNDQGGILDFEQTISGDYGHIVSGNDGISVWSVYPGFALYYPDLPGGINSLTWNFVGSGYLWMPPLMADPDDPHSVYIGGGGSGGAHIMHLTAGSWSITHEQLPFDFSGAGAAQISALACSPIDSDHRYVLTNNGRFYHSSDGGDDWNMSAGFSGPETHYFYGSSLLPSQVQEGRVFFAGSGYSNPPVYKTDNQGGSFSSMSAGLPNTLVFQLAATPEEDLLFAATEVGPYVYVADNQEWVDLTGIGAPDQVYWCVEYIPEIQTARFGTYGRGIWDFVLDDYYWISAGDLNDDGTVNVQDVIILVNIILENFEASETDLIAGDLNNDGEINVGDIVLTVNLILGD